MFTGLADAINAIPYAFWPAVVGLAVMRMVINAVTGR